MTPRSPSTDDRSIVRREFLQKGALTTGAVLVGMSAVSGSAAAHGDSEPEPCVRSPGYWKTHEEDWPVEEIPIGWFKDENADLDVTVAGTGGIVYSKQQLLEFLNSPVRGDKSLILVKALIAAKLNAYNGSDYWCVDDNIRRADNWFYNIAQDINGDPVASGVRKWDEGGEDAEPIYRKLDRYNNTGLNCACAED